VRLQPAIPPANVYEANGQLSIAVPVPGSHREHTSVVVHPDRLQVVAECKYPQAEQHYLRRDWQVGAWELDLDLPLRIDPDRAHATLRYGVLVVMAPVSPSGSGESRLPVE
jgi:HSP20 family molecular chaperone IbpA